MYDFSEDHKGDKGELRPKSLLPAWLKWYEGVSDLNPPAARFYRMVTLAKDSMNR